MRTKIIALAGCLLFILIGCRPAATAAVTAPPPTISSTPRLPDFTLSTATPIPLAQTPSPVTPTLTPVGVRVEVSTPQALIGQSSGVGSLDFSPDGSLLASTGDDGTIRLWDVATGQMMQVFQGGAGYMSGLDFSPDGQLLAAIEQDATIAFWDLSSRQVSRRIDDPGLDACGVEFSPDGTMMASGHVDGIVRLWDVGSGEPVRELRGLEELSCSVAFSPDGSRIASGGGGADFRVLIWEVSSGELLHKLGGHTANVYRVAYSPDGASLASASGDRTIRVWDAGSGELRYTLVADEFKMSAVDFSPDSSLLVSGGIDGLVRLWDVASGQLLVALQGHKGEIFSVAFSPVDRVFASGGERGEVLLWRITSVETPVVAATPILTAEPSVTWFTDFVAYLEELVSNDQFSGAVLIAQESEIRLEEAYGLADQSLAIPNQIDTKFNLGSMNKMFTAVAILQLMESDKLSLEDTIIQHIPDYPNTEVATVVTIHQLLTHTSGLGDVFTEEFSANPHQYRSNADFLPLFVNEPLQFQPGEQFSYSNAGYVVLGLIIERVSGQSYDEYIQQNIYDPSGMVNTGAFEIDADTPNLAVGYTTRNIWGNETGILTSNTALMPGEGFAAGGGYSTVEDLLNFRNALLSFELLNPESTELLLTGKVVVRENSNYAYGFFDRVVAGQRVVGHGGGAPGVCSSLNMYPDTGYTVIVLSNSDNGCILVLDYLKDKPLE